MGVPQNGWFIREKTIKMDDLGAPLFSETSIWVLQCRCDAYFHFHFCSCSRITNPKNREMHFACTGFCSDMSWEPNS